MYTDFGCSQNGMYAAVVNYSLLCRIFLSLHVGCAINSSLELFAVVCSLTQEMTN